MCNVFFINSMNHAAYFTTVASSYDTKIEISKGDKCYYTPNGINIIPRGVQNAANGNKVTICHAPKISQDDKVFIVRPWGIETDFVEILEAKPVRRVSDYWVEKVLSSPHVYTYTDEEMASKVSNSNSFGSPFVYEGERWSGILNVGNTHHTGTYGGHNVIEGQAEKNLKLISAARVGAELTDTYNVTDGQGYEKFLKVKPNCWVMSEGKFHSRSNNEDDCVYDPIDGYTYTCSDNSCDIPHDHFEQLEAQASKPRGSQKYRASC